MTFRKTVRRSGPPRGGRGKPTRHDKKRRTDPAVRAKAEKLHESGMPFQLAMAVALGRVDLNTALERLARQEKVARVMEEHQLSRALATQVVLGHAELDVILQRRRLEAHREQYRGKSCLDDAAASGEPLTLGLHGDRRLVGRVAEVEAYRFTVVPQTKEGEGEPETLHKLQVKYAHAPDDWKKVRKGLKKHKGLSAEPREPIERPQDRYSCSDRRLFRVVDQEALIEVTLLEGEQIRGTVVWFSRYEMGMRIKGSEVPIVVFRHALFDVSEL